MIANAAPEMQVVMRVRRIDIAVLASIILHALFFLTVLPKKLVHDPIGPVTDQPLNVTIAQPPPPAPETPVVPPEPVPKPAPPRTPLVRQPSLVPRSEPVPQITVPTPAPAPLAPPPPTPQVDMMAAMRERRAERQASEAAAASPGTASKGDAATRNLQTLSGREGVGGVFEILRKGTRTAEFAFNGWRPESRRQWREVIEVDAGQGGNVELAIVKRMISLIRDHYKGDFQWESHRLGRVVKLSAALEDNEGLEDFMMKEFFGQPVVNPRR